MLITQYLDPKNDFAFKRIFGTQKNQDILIHFINDILGFKGEQQITQVTFLPTNQDPNIAAKKQSLVDVLCADQHGCQYIVEMQVAKTEGFEKRAQYYAAKAYASQLARGENYSQLKAIIFVAITDFVMFADKAAYQSNHVILDKATYSHDLKDFSFTFLELPKFTKTLNELSNIVDKWLYFFKHADVTKQTELKQIVGEDEVIQRAYEELNRFGWTEIELNTYEQEEKRERDARAILSQQLLDIKARIKKEIAEDIKKEIEKNVKKGIKDINRVREQIKEESERATQILIAKKLLAANLLPEKIADITGLPVDTIKSFLEP